MKYTQESLATWIDKLKVSFIASVDEEGIPCMKAMLAPRKREGLREFYFTTNTCSKRVAQYRQNPKASIYFYEKGRFKYQGLMLKGTMEVLEDDAIKQEIWRTGDTMYYHEGVTDPDYCVLHFTAHEGRLYSGLQHDSFVIQE